jgi:hypothetical protein
MLKQIVMLDQYQKDCVHVLQEALEQAEAGNISSIALVAVMKGRGTAVNMAGLQAADLYFGAGRVMSNIQDALKTQNSGIIR